MPFLYQADLGSWGEEQCLLLGEDAQLLCLTLHLAQTDRLLLPQPTGWRGSGLNQNLSQIPGEVSSISNRSRNRIAARSVWCVALSSCPSPGWGCRRAQLAVETMLLSMQEAGLLFQVIPIFSPLLPQLFSLSELHRDECLHFQPSQ